MKQFRWDPIKNAWLLRERGISFEEVVVAIAQGHVLDIVEHPHPERHQQQRMFIVEMHRYAYLVPFLETADDILLKTVIPSRKATKQYLQKEAT